MPVTTTPAPTVAAPLDCGIASVRFAYSTS
jgi:hypothetical protein